MEWRERSPPRNGQEAVESQRRGHRDACQPSRHFPLPCIAASAIVVFSWARSVPQASITIRRSSGSSSSLKTPPEFHCAHVVLKFCPVGDRFCPVGNTPPALGPRWAGVGCPLTDWSCPASDRVCPDLARGEMVEAGGVEPPAIGIEHNVTASPRRPVPHRHADAAGGMRVTRRGFRDSAGRRGTDGCRPSGTVGGHRCAGGMLCTRVVTLTKRPTCRGDWREDGSWACLRPRRGVAG